MDIYRCWNIADCCIVNTPAILITNNRYWVAGPAAAPPAYRLYNLYIDMGSVGLYILLQVCYMGDMPACSVSL